ncbi:E3 ubiquitin-protein ligase tom1, partial [Coemansia sp. RSA 2611]
GSADAAKPEEARDGESFMEYLAKKEKLPAFEPYELDAESERLACRVAEFVVQEILTLKPAASGPPPVARAATTISGAASEAPQHGMPPATPVGKLRTSTSYAGLSTPVSSTMAAASVPDDSPDTIAYRCYLMQSLSELVSSFPFVLQALFTARNVAPIGLLSPRKANKGKAPAAAAASEEQGQPQQPSMRIRSPLISHLVHDLIVREAVTNANAPKGPGRSEEAASAAAAAGGSELEQVLAIARHQISIKRGQLSQHVTSWAMALLSTICVRHQEGWTTTASGDGAAVAGPKVDGDNEVTIDLMAGSYSTALYVARHLTLDHVFRAFRECLAATSGSPQHGNDVTYARLTSLARLTHRLVTARAVQPGRLAPGGGVASGDQAGKENPNMLKKMLLERGILDLLTVAGSRLNLNHPQGREMLNLFLRPIELLAKAAVKISRESVLQAWEESGQDKMPSSAVSTGARGGFNMDLLEDDNALIAEDDDIPPDLYENSALGLYQNQRTGHEAGDMFNEDDLMEEDFEEELYDEDNSSASDIDSDDEDMDESMLLDEHNADDAEAGDDMDMDGSVVGIRRSRGDGDDDDDDDGLSDSESGSISGDDDGDDEDDDDDLDDDEDGEGLDTDLELGLELGGGRRGQSAADFLAFEEDRMMAADEREADFYGSDLDGEVVQSEDGRLEGEDDADQDGGWESELSDADLGMLEAIHHTLTHHAHRHHGHMHVRAAARSRPASGDGSARAAAAALDAGGEGADDDVDDDDDNEGSGSTSEDESHSESGDDPDMFPAGFPDSLEITMEAIDGPAGGGRATAAALERASGLSALLMETMAAGLAIGRGGGGGAHHHRINGLPGLGRLGSLNGVS